MLPAMSPNELFTIWAYLMYLLWSILVTVWVARTLHRNGRVFLVDAFQGNEALADSVNHLLVVGFYLINIGYVALALKQRPTPDSVQTAIEFFSTKMGWVLVVLGGMHFFNMFVLSRLRRTGLLRRMPPPIPPREHVAVRQG